MTMFNTIIFIMETKETFYVNWINYYPCNSSNTIILPIYLSYIISCYTVILLCLLWSIVLLFFFLGVEKNNDDAHNVLLRQKSNNWDSPTDILQTETRLWASRKRERKPRAYNNKKMKNIGILTLRDPVLNADVFQLKWKNEKICPLQ